MLKTPGVDKCVPMFGTKNADAYLSGRFARAGLQMKKKKKKKKQRKLRSEHPGDAGANPTRIADIKN